MKNTYFAFFIWGITCFPVFSDDVISILYFENTTQNSEYQWLQKGLADMLISDLGSISGLKIVEREALEKILQEQALSLTGLVQNGPSREIGELLQANKLLYGSYIISDDEIRIDLKIGDVMSGQIIAGHQVQGDIDDIFDLEDNLSQIIRKSLNLDTAQVPQIRETQSIAALALYYTGLDHLDHQRYEQARDEFSKAKSLDPLFIKAQQGLADAYKFLKAFREYRQQNEIMKLYAKVNALRRRIETPQWLTFADIVMTPEYQSMSAEEQQTFIASHNELAICNSPAQCTWHIMLILDEIGRKSVEYFADTQLKTDLLNRVIQIGEQSRSRFKSDPFLPEILYIQIFALYRLKDFHRLKTLSEEFLINFPEYRMVETVEDYYQRALDALSNNG